MSNNLSVKITADVADLQAKFAVARAETNALATEMNKLARASAGGTIDAAGSARLKQLAGDLVAARSQAGGYASEMAKAGYSVSGFASSLEHSHGSISTATREFRALFDELSSGRTRQTPGTVAILLQRVMGLGPAALLAVGGVIALTAGIGYLIVKSVEASRALDQADLGAKFAGNLAITRDLIKQFTDILSSSAGISSSAAREIAAGFASMHDTSVPEMNALVSVVSDFARITGQKAPKAAEELTKIFASKETAAEFAKTIGAVTQAQINAAESADKSGDANQVFATKLDLLNSAMGRATATLAKHDSGVLASMRNFMAYLGMQESGMTTQEAQNELLETQNEQRQKQVALLKSLGDQIRATPPSADQTLKTGVSVAEKENPVAMQIDEAKSKVTELTAALAVAQQRGDEIDITKLNAGLAKAQEELSQLQFGPVLERMRTDMANLAATWDGTQSGMLTKQRQIAQQALSQEQAGSKDYLSIQQEISRLSVQIRQGAGEEIIANAREQVSQIGSATAVGAAQRLQQESAIWRQVLAGDQLTASQRVEVQRSMNAALASLERERANEQRSIAQSNATTDIAISKLNIDAEKQALDLELQAHKINAAQKLEILRLLTSQEAALDIQNLQNELASLSDQPVEYNRVYNEIRELKARLVVDLGMLDKQAAADAKAGARQQASDWKGTVSEIESSESSLVSNLLTRRKSLTASLEQLSGELITKEIANDLKAMTTRLLLANTEENGTKAMEQGGYLYHLMFTNQATAATVASQAAQTSATVAGNTARTAATISGAAASRSVAAATGASTVMADAAKAFSGTYASVAQIPYVGWILAPAAAAGAFAAVAGYESLASLDVGTQYVPKDMPAMLHEGEAVVPKPYAQGMRQSGAFNGPPGGAGGYHEEHNYHGDVNVNAMDAGSLKKYLGRPGGRDAVVQAGIRAYRRGAR